MLVLHSNDFLVVEHFSDGVVSLSTPIIDPHPNPSEYPNNRGIQIKYEAQFKKLKPTSINKNTQSVINNKTLFCAICDMYPTINDIMCVLNGKYDISVLLYVKKLQNVFWYSERSASDTSLSGSAFVF